MQKQIVKYLYTFALAALLVLIPLTAQAAAVDIPCRPSETGANGLFTCVNQLYKYALVICSIAAVIMIMIGGYMYIFSGGNEKRVGTAKSFISSSLIGIAVLLVGFVLLRQINPSLLTIKNITPNQIAFEKWKVDGHMFDDDWDFNAGGQSGNIGGQGVTGNNSGPSGHKSSELQCSFQGNKANYVPYMTEALFQAVQALCAEVKSKGITAAISSISTGHISKPGSLHNRGCAVDFAGGDDYYVNHPTGKAVIEAAKKLGLRVNPGSDANQTFHVHVDVGIENCTAPILPISNRQ